MDGYWTSSFFAISMAEKKSRSIRTQKRLNELGQQRMFYMVKKITFLAAPTLVANQNAGFASSCPLADSAELKGWLLAKFFFGTFKTA